MQTILRKSNDRLQTKISWLESYHTFSFGEHYDPKWMGFSNLRVINDDYIEANQGFPFHPHKNMEIITFMLNGSLRHKDSLGNNMSITPGELQVMSAGTGITHSEFSENNENSDRVHLLQIWIMPKENNISPRYDQKFIRNSAEKNFLKIIASDDQNLESAMFINANAHIWQGSMEENTTFEFSAKSRKNLWIHVYEGSVNILENTLSSGDALGVVSADQSFKISNNSKAKTEFLIFELE
jgi:redox-sensitive bicupin YhaK (pirin superfamily)